MFDYTGRRGPRVAAAAAGAQVYVRVLEGYIISLLCLSATGLLA